MMKIEQRRLKVFNIISVLVLVAVLLTACGGVTFHGQALPSRQGGVEIARDGRSIQPDSARTGPTGNLAIITGIILLMVGFGVLMLTLVLLVGRNLLRPSPS